jgi:hypothetical protein
LLSRSGGQAYYDTDLGITWLTDAAFAATNPFGVPDAGERTTWVKAQEWLAALNSANYLGVANWRLPSTLQPDPACTDQVLFVTGTQSSGQNCTGSEMGHLFYVEHISRDHPGPFLNVFNSWSDTSFEPFPNLAWVFTFTNGFQDLGVKNANLFPAWAVRTGDIASSAPEPATDILAGRCKPYLRSRTRHVADASAVIASIRRTAGDSLVGLVGLEPTTKGL